MALLKTTKVAVSFRPRGVLSGFLVIVPELGGGVFVPPVGAKAPNKFIRMRLGEEVLREGAGAIFSAYQHGQEIVVEDVLMWMGTSLFHTTGFLERWHTWMPRFTAAWKPDAALQGTTVRFAEPMNMATFVAGAQREGDVVEFIGCGVGARRLVWIPMEEVAAKQKMMARREAGMGPDVYSLWTTTATEPNKGRVACPALVRTLAVSRALRQMPSDEFDVEVAWNKMFERQEIVGIPDTPNKPKQNVKTAA